MANAAVSCGCPPDVAGEVPQGIDRGGNMKATTKMSPEIDNYSLSPESKQLTYIATHVKITNLS